MVEQIIRTFGVILELVIVVPTILGTIAVAISRANKRDSVMIGGFYGQVIFGGLGVIVHELSHLIVALLFGHHIQSVCLLHIPRASDPHDRGLGYVGHVWNDDSMYQKVGNVFIGIAPVVGCALAMIFSTRWLVPDLYNRWLESTGNTTIPGGQSTWWQWLLWLILMVNISIGGFDLSSADLENSRQGITALIIVIVLAALIGGWLFDPQTIYQHLFYFLQPFYYALAFAILINLALWLVMTIIVHFRSNHWIIDRFLVQD